MEPIKFQNEDLKQQISSAPQSSEATGMRRDNESIDDFEHLDPESSPVKENQGQGSQIKVDKFSDLSQKTSMSMDPFNTCQNTFDLSFPSKPEMDPIDTSKFGEGNLISSSDLLGSNDFAKSEHLQEKPAFPQHSQDLLLGFSTEPIVKSEFDQPISTGDKHPSQFETEYDSDKVRSNKTLSQTFMDTEREEVEDNSAEFNMHIPDKFTSDVEFLKSEMKTSNVPDLDVNVPSSLKSDILSSNSPHDKYLDSFKDSESLLSSSNLNSKDEFGSSKSSVSVQEEDDLFLHEDKLQEQPEFTIKPTPIVSEPYKKTVPSGPEPVNTIEVEPSLKPEIVPAAEPNIKLSSDKTDIKSAKSEVQTEDSDLEEIKPIQLFQSMGLDAWFKPDRLHPKVVELVYWRDPKKSGIVFGSVLGVLLSLSYFSLISVVAYLSLALLTGTISFRIYKNVLQAVQKTSDGHPFKDILELDLTLPQDKVREVTDIAVAHVNAAALELRRLFLVEDLVDSIKFGVLLWCLTYVGSWFNGMTLIIIAFVALFTLPKVYENNKAQIDQNLDVVRSKIADITSKVKAAIPIGKKPAAEEEKKDQ